MINMLDELPIPQEAHVLTIKPSSVVSASLAITDVQRRLHDD